MHIHTSPVLKTVYPDAKGRVTLGALTKGISSFEVMQDEDKIILVPYTEIPAKEKWLFANKIAWQKVKQGIQDSAAKRVRSRGGFKKHLHDKTHG